MRIFWSSSWHEDTILIQTAGKPGEPPRSSRLALVLILAITTSCGLLPLTRFSRKGADVLERAPKPPPIDSEFKGCGPGGSQPDYALNLRKNRIDTAATYVAVPFQVIARLPWPRQAALRFRNQWARGERSDVARYEGAPVQLAGYMMSFKLEIPEPPNCYSGDADNKDYHIWLTLRPHENRKRSVVVEITPRVRVFHPGWTEATLRTLVDSQIPVRVSGWLMLDQMHPEQVNQHRITLWEVHPITRIERQRSDSSWATLDSL